jgi:ElaB/YqjD/DUF883 family membrane-anchored ribosome-binding protein
MSKEIQLYKSQTEEIQELLSEMKKLNAHIEHNMKYLGDMVHSVSRMSEKCEDNMKRLNNMMLELKGLVCAIRPQVKKSGWYGEELNVKEKEINPKSIEINHIK